MTIRPVFIPRLKGPIGVDERRCTLTGIGSILEISSRSHDHTGVEMSAAHLHVAPRLVRRPCSVEAAFQGSKVFERGGPYVELIGMDADVARQDHRLKTSGKLLRFEFGGKCFPAAPFTYFYDWLYINSVAAEPRLLKELASFAGFTDSEFDPVESLNSQAQSAALCRSLLAQDLLAEALVSPERFLDIAYAA